MNHLINELFKKIKSDDERIRSNAITDISLVLEMNSWQLPLEKRMSRYRILIKEELININLSQSEEAEIIEFLQKEITEFNKSTYSLLFTIGQASSSTGLAPLLDIIKNYSGGFNANESYQALVSLERLLFWDDNGINDYQLSDEKKRNLIYQSNPIPFIKSKLVWALNNSNSAHSSGLYDTAKRLLDALSEFLDKPNKLSD
ncbi:hypothetical protein H6G74_04755 [Nostoc spongiaeforme FACHB-130]|uniref:Uncharacterized protein n=1 Tax=Nostoc spongiaeforme FACHB-130 TaxID=1357510 RepID=A0ABR8FUB6_9NOSO|nr:hypothetical protein [Nostoc spongiaeforme]MBD2593639.1 hypothetical protein [Nostoc spongiaeforme FACHB-130]